MKNKSRRKLVLQLNVNHPDLSPTELEKILSIRADESWSRGDSYTSSPNSGVRRYKFSRWAIKEMASSLDDLPEAIQRLFRRLDGYVDNFLLLPEEARVALTLLVDETQSVIGTGFDFHVIQFLAKIRAEVDISLVVDAREEYEAYKKSL